MSEPPAAAPRRPDHTRGQGARGEDLACAYLAAQGYTILSRNLWLRSEDGLRREVDILACQGDTLVLVEVKLRRRGDDTDPLEAVTPRKLHHMQEAALLLLQDPAYAGQNVRLDVIAVSLHHREARITHLKDLETDSGGR